MDKGSGGDIRGAGETNWMTLSSLVYLQLDACLWMPVQALNFYFVPPSFRVLFVSCAALVDSFFLAHIKQIESGESEEQRTD